MTLVVQRAQPEATGKEKRKRVVVILSYASPTLQERQSHRQVTGLQVSKRSPRPTPVGDRSAWLRVVEPPALTCLAARPSQSVMLAAWRSADRQGQACRDSERASMCLEGRAQR